MSRYKGMQSLLIKPIINITKEKIKERLDGEHEFDFYLQFYKDYFNFQSKEIVCNQYKNINAALNKLCENKVSIDGKTDVLLEKVRGGKGCVSSFVLPKEKLLNIIQEVKNEKRN